MKLFAGRRLRRAREARGLSQAALARRIGFSPSYLNQIEHDQRPLTVPVLLRLAAELEIDARELSDDDGRLLADVAAALADPVAVAAGTVPPDDVAEVAAALPEVARALVALQRRATDAGRRVEEMAVGMGARMPEGAALPVSPHDEVLDFVYDNHNHFAELDVAAERIAAETGGGAEALAGLLAARHGVRVEDGPPGGDRRRFDPATRTLRLAPGLDSGRRAFQLASQWALLEHGEALDRLAAPLSGRESRALARIGLASYFAGAVVLPYRAFHGAAEEVGYDIALLSQRFGVSIETVCHRLSTLQRPGREGVPFFFVRVDRAGNISKRHSATDFHFARTGGTCPLWNVYEAFSSPGRFVTQVASVPDGRTYFWVARTVGRREGGWGSPGVEFALGLGCDVRHAGRLVYARGLDLEDPGAAVPIGPGCRLCERTDCPQRAFPLLGRPLEADADRAALAPYPTAWATGR